MADGGWRMADEDVACEFYTVTVTAIYGVLKTPHEIANRKMPAKAHNFHLRPPLVGVACERCFSIRCFGRDCKDYQYPVVLRWILH